MKSRRRRVIAVKEVDAERDRYVGLFY